MSIGEIIEIDRPESWPTDLTTYLQAIAATVPEDVTDGQDLPDKADLAAQDDGLRELLAGRALRTFHATRLLDYEASGIRASGLRILTESLVEDRQDKALAEGVITPEEHLALRNSSVFKAGKMTSYRVGKVCLAGNARPLHEHPSGFWHQLSSWGGEAQYMTGAWKLLNSQRVKELGQPAIVVTLVDASNPKIAVVPGHELIYAFVASYRGMTRVGSQIDFEADIPGSRIEDIWQPGRSEYDQFELLPR